LGHSAFCIALKRNCNEAKPDWQLAPSSQRPNAVHRCEYCTGNGLVAQALPIKFQLGAHRRIRRNVPDILKSPDAPILMLTIVIYSASSIRAARWMTMMYGSQYLELQPAEAEEFEMRAHEQGFSFRVF
jgi:hypothetical protein